MVGCDITTFGAQAAALAVGGHSAEFMAEYPSDSRGNRTGS
jgi:hypothetical protein